VSHKYHLRIEVRGAQPKDDNLVLDEIVPKWWNGDYGRKEDVLYVEGVDRLCGAGDISDMKQDLKKQLRDLLGYHVQVEIDVVRDLELA